MSGRWRNSITQLKLILYTSCAGRSLLGNPYHSTRPNPCLPGRNDAKEPQYMLSWERFQQPLHRPHPPNSSRHHSHWWNLHRETHPQVGHSAVFFHGNRKRSTGLIRSIHIFRLKARIGTDGRDSTASQRHGTEKTTTATCFPVLCTCAMEIFINIRNTHITTRDCCIYPRQFQRKRF